MAGCPGWQLAGLPLSIKPGSGATANGAASPHRSKEVTMAVIKKSKRRKEGRRHGGEKESPDNLKTREDGCVLALFKRKPWKSLSLSLSHTKTSHSLFLSPRLSRGFVLKVVDGRMSGL